MASKPLVFFLLISLALSTVLHFTYFKRENTFDFPVDVVYTWAGEHVDPTDVGLADNKELKYSLKFLDRNLPWVRHIFVVMNPPVTRPHWYSELPESIRNKITFLDHYDVFVDEKDLPCTNSNSIESNLARVPGLKEHFIYFNDDVFVLKPTEKRDFFTVTGLAIVSSQTTRPPRRLQLKQGTFVPRSIELPPMYKGFYPHVPIPLRKSQLIAFENEFKPYSDWVRSHKTRKGPGCDICRHYQLSCPCMQMQTGIAPFMTKNGFALATPMDNRATCSNPAYVNSLCYEKLTAPIQSRFLVIQDTERNPARRRIYDEHRQAFFKRSFPD